MKNYILSLCILFATACHKQNDWLDVKTAKADVVPSKLSDYQALLDYDDTYMNANYPFLPQASTDDYYLTYSNWQAGLANARNAYIWAPDIYAGGNSSDWNTSYVMIGYANVCLEGLKSIAKDATNTLAWDNIYGSAHFYKALSYYMLAQEFAPPYNAASAAKDLGIPLRNTTDVSVLVQRSSVKDTWQEIINNFQVAESSLPDFPAFLTRPSRGAARALLARANLAMGNYQGAKDWADKALAQTSYVLDFNTLNSASTYPLPTYQSGNKELFIYATTTVSALHIFNGLVDSTLYKSYNTNDLRRTLYFKPSGNGVAFRGQYTGTAYPFGGIATNEVLLIRAEANARLGNIPAAMADLNTLLVKRWKTGTYTPYTALDAQDALQKILTERRKELLFYANTRWDDLRRLNQDPAFAKTLTRDLNGTTYTLPPNDPRYVMPIPDNEIRASGIQQNPR